MRRTLRKLDSPRSRPTHEDDEERNYETMVMIDNVLSEMAEASGLERFLFMLNEASVELFNHIEKAYEQRDQPSMQRLC